MSAVCSAELVSESTRLDKELNGTSAGDDAAAIMNSIASAEANLLFSEAMGFIPAAARLSVKPGGNVVAPVVRLVVPNPCASCE